MGVTLQKDAANVVDTNRFLFLERNEVNLREAVNLMQGRSVYRIPGYAGQGSYWLTLKTEQRYEGIAPLELKKSGLETGKAINEMSLPFALTSAQRMEIERSLQGGNRHALDFKYQRKDYRIWLQANPAEDPVDVLDKRGRRVEWLDFEKQVIKDQAPTLPGHRLQR
jgi:hypothetical protein